MAAWLHSLLVTISSEAKKSLMWAVLRSRNFFGRLRLRKSQVPEPTPASTKLANKGGPRWLRLHTLKCFILSSQKGNYSWKYFLDHIYLYKLLLSHVCHKNKAFLFACQKDTARAALKKAAPALGSGQQQKSAPPPP